MVINIQSIHFKAPETLEAYVQEKVGKLFSINDKILRAEVVLSEGSDSVNRCECEIRLIMPGKDQIARKSADTYEKAVHGTMSTLRRRLRDQKKR